MFLFGAAVALWPDAREQRRLVDATRTSAHDARPRDRPGRGGGRCSSRCRSSASRRSTDDRLDAPSEDELRRLALVEERDRALAALKELEFDHRSGELDDEDYRELVGPLRQAVAAALRAIEQDRRRDSAVTVRRSSRRRRRNRRPMGRIMLALVVALVLRHAGARRRHRPQAADRHEDLLAAGPARRAEAARAALRSEVAGYTSRIRSLEARVGDVSLRLATLEADLSLHQQRLDALDALFRPADRAARRSCEQQYAHGRSRRLNRRLVDIYESEPAVDARGRARRALDLRTRSTRCST